jgi:hypothetical protein
MTMNEQQNTTPWKNLGEASVYAKRGRRFLAREVKAGRLRAARVGGRREFLTRAEWIDQWLEDLAQPVTVRRTR